MEFKCSVCDKTKKLNSDEIIKFFKHAKEMDKDIKVSDYPGIFSALDEKTCLKHKKHTYLFSLNADSMIEELIEEHEKILRNEKIREFENKDIDQMIENGHKIIEDANERRESYNKGMIKINDRKRKLDDRMLEKLGSDNYSILSHDISDELDMWDKEVKRINEEENEDKNDNE